LNWAAFHGNTGSRADWNLSGGAIVAELHSRLCAEIASRNRNFAARIRPLIGVPTKFVILPFYSGVISPQLLKGRDVFLSKQPKVLFHPIRIGRNHFDLCASSALAFPKSCSVSLISNSFLDSAVLNQKSKFVPSVASRTASNPASSIWPSGRNHISLGHLTSSLQPLNAVSRQ